MVEGGATLRSHYEAVERTGRIVPELHPEPPPDEMQFLWRTFMALSLTRDSGFGGPERIKMREVEAWCRLTDTPLTAWQIGVVQRLDSVFIEIANDHTKKEMDRKERAQKADRPLAPPTRVRKR